MQEKLTSTPPRRRGSSQLRLFARPRYNSHWTGLSPDVQQKILRLLAQLLRQHRADRAAEVAKEAHDE
jgi:alkylhydroperoxidase family enzyme